MRAFALLVALIVGASPAAFEVCQIVCASEAAASIAVAASPACHHGGASAHRSAAPGSERLLPASGECSHGGRAVLAPGLTTPRLVNVGAFAARTAALEMRIALSAGHVDALSSRPPIDSAHLPFPVPLRL